MSRERFWKSENLETFFVIENELRTKLAHKNLCEEISALKPKSILDYGCGHGELAENLEDDRLESYVGLEVSSHCLDVARRKIKMRNAIFQSMQDFSVSEDLFECAVLSFVLVVLKDNNEIIEVLSNIRKRLSVNARLFITDTHPCFRAFEFSSYGTNFSTLDYRCDYKSFNVHMRDLEDEKKRVEFCDYHKSLTEIFSCLYKTGFSVNRFVELYDKEFDSNSECSNSRVNDKVPPYYFLEAIPRKIE